MFDHPANTRAKAADCGAYSAPHEPSACEMNLAGLRAVARLLDRMKLRVPDVANHGGEEINHVVSGLFKRYADRLMRCFGSNLSGELDATSEFGSVQQVRNSLFPMSMPFLIGEF